MKYDLVICGASMTNDKPWNTWATYVKEGYAWNSVRDVSNRGSGNTLIVTNAIAESTKVDNPFIAVMLTTFDKWDFVTDDPEKLARFDKEKNPTYYLDEGLGVWPTGSHFPLDKEHFKKEYYCQDWLTINNLNLINYLLLFCQSHNIPLLMLTDAPIFSTTEEYLNQGLFNDASIMNKRTQRYKDLIDYDFYEPGLLGYAEKYKMQWRHKKFGTHPGSMVHLKYFKDIYEQKLLDLGATYIDNPVLLEQFRLDQDLWDNTNE